MIVRVTRSPLRLLGLALVAVAMIALALDMLVFYRYFPDPETTQGTRQVTLEDGSVVEESVRVYTATGLAQRRRDVGWGLVFLVAGSASFIWAGAGLVVPRRLVVADASGISLSLAGRRRAPLRLGWEEIAEARSGLRQDEGGDVPVLSLRLHAAERVPPRPRGAVADPPWLHLFSGEWDRPAHEVAALIEQHVSGSRYWEAYG